MIPDQNCGNCFFARGMEVDTLECRVNPPTGVPMDEGLFAGSFWPPVPADGWCGCWQPLPDLSPLPDLPEPESQPDDIDTYD